MEETTVVIESVSITFIILINNNLNGHPNKKKEKTGHFAVKTALNIQ